MVKLYIKYEYFMLLKDPTYKSIKRNWENVTEKCLS